MKLSELKQEIQNIVEGRGVKTIQKDYQQVVSDIEKALDFYKKNKNTDKKDAFVKVLKKLGKRKKELESELDNKVSGMYKDAEFKGESVVNESKFKPELGKVYSNPYATAFKPINQIKEETDSDTKMALNQLSQCVSSAESLKEMLQGSDELEPWVQSKITKAEDYLNTVLGYYKGKQSKE